MKNTLQLFALLCLGIFCLSPSYGQTRLYVNGSIASSGAGTSWATAKKSLTEALGLANSGTGTYEIWVRTGTYYPSTSAGASTTSRDSSFRILRNGIKIYGGFAGTETALSQRNIALNVTTLSGDIGTLNDSTDNSYHVMTVISSSGVPIDTTAVVDGFTITRATANGGTSFTLGTVGVIINSDGGGLLNITNSAGQVASPLIQNCIFQNNYAGVGGAIYNRGNQGVSSPIVRDCQFLQNSAMDVGGIHAYSAGGGTSSPKIIRCIFMGNQANTGAAAGVYQWSSSTASPTYIDCAFDGNIAKYESGAIYLYFGSLSATNCVFTRNRVSTVASNGGGAIGLAAGTSATFTNCTFSENTVASTALNSNTFDNRGALYLYNTIVWGYVYGQITTSGSGSLTASYSDLRGITPFGTNLSADPMFKNTSDPDGVDNIWGTADDGLAISYCSIAENSGSNALIPAGITTDITGAPRVQWTIVDMGAYENVIRGTKYYVDSSVVASGNGLSWATPFKTLSEALYRANSMLCVDTIWVKKGTYWPSTNFGVTTTRRDSSFRILRNGLKVYGGFAGTETSLSQRNIVANPTVLSGDLGVPNNNADNSYHVFTIFTPLGIGLIDTNTRLDGFIIQDGNATTLASGSPYGFGYIHQDGGGLYFGAFGTGICDPSIANCTFSDNLANYGAAVYVNAFTGNPVRCNGSFTKCSFLSNHSNYSGAGIYNNGFAFNINQKITDCNFQDNIAGTNGAAIYSSNSKLVFTADTFRRNTSTNSGGALYNNSCEVVMTDGLFEQNKSMNFNGGAIYNYLTPGSVTNTWFSKDTALRGGAIYTSYRPWTYEGCTFRDNTSKTGAGGAVYLENNKSTFNQCEFSSNVAATLGAAIYGSADTVSLLNSSVANNICKNPGQDNTGAVTLQGIIGQLTVDSCVFTGNRGVGGFGAAVSSQATTSISRTSFSGNSALAGGAVGMTGGGRNMLIEHCTFSNNTAILNAGAFISMFNASATVQHSTFDGNSSVSPGGAFYSQNNGLVTFVSDTFRNNRSSSAGGVMAHNTNPSVISDCYFVGNRSQNGNGGGIYTSGRMSLTKSIFLNDTATAGGAIYTYNSDSVRLDGNLFKDCRALTGSGGAIWADRSGDSIVNNVFIGNQSTTSSGGAIVTSLSSIYGSFVANNTFYQNASPLGQGGGIRVDGSSGKLDFYNNILWQNTASTNALVHDATTGTAIVNQGNNFSSSDPKFLNTASPSGVDNIWGTGDDGFTLTQCSPAINYGTNLTYPWFTTDAAAATRIQQSTVDAGAYETALNNIAVMPVVSMSVSPNDTVCANASVTFTASPLLGGASPQYQWYRNGAPVGTSSTSFVPSSLSNGDSIRVALMSSVTCPIEDTVYSAYIRMELLPAPTITTTSKTNPSACSGTNGTITLYGLAPNTSHTINYDLGGVPQTSVIKTSTGSGSLTITGLAAGSYTNFTATIMPCTSTPFAGPVVLTSPSAPVISSVSKTDPSGCGTADGTMTINGLTASTTYDFTYYNGSSTISLTSQTTNTSGSYTITGLTAGTYSNFTATRLGCTGNFSGPITLSSPAAPFISSMTKSNPTTCGGTNGSVTLYGLIASTSYTVSYFNGTATISLGTVTSTSLGTIIVSSLAAGTYSAFTATRLGCSGTNTGSITLYNPAPPSISSVTKTDPTTCGGTNGTITVNGLLPSQTYTITYYNGSTTVTLTGQVSNGAGAIVVSGLPAGTYSAVTASRLGCSDTYSGSVTLNPPTTPAAPTAGNSGPVCSGNTLNLSCSPVVGATYTWTGPNSFSSSNPNPSISNVTSAHAGVYSVTVTVSGCTSAPDTTTVLVNPTPVISSVTSTSPTTCGGNNGAIQVNGLTPGSTYTINYSKGGVPQIAFVGLANASGTVTISGQGLGVYTAFSASLGSCTSIPTGNVTISNPPAPTTPTISSNSTRCAGDTLKLFTTTNTGVSYTWTGPNGFTASNQNPFIVSATTAATGTYSLVVTDLATGCSSSAATLVATVYPLPVITSSSATNPLTCNGTTGTISLNGLAPSTTFSVGYTRNGVPHAAVAASSNSVGTLVITGLNAGVYTNISVSSNGCPSNAVASITLSDPPIPPAPSASSNSPVCQGTTLNLAATGQTGASFSWTGPNSFSASIALATISNMQAVNVGTYQVTQTVAGCVSPAATTNVLMSTPPATPGPISGDTLPCVNSSYTYSVAAVPTATSYTWTLPSGWSGSSTGNSITVTSSTTAGTVSVRANNTCGSSAASSINTSILAIPAQPGIISGLTSLCNGTYTSYSISTVSLASSYTWTMPSGWTGYNFVNNLTVTAGPNSGNISVTADNKCGSSPIRNLAVTVTSIPAQPGIITGSTTPCINSIQSYATPSVSGATSYVWTYPTGWSGGSTSNTANLTIGANSGTITVAARNACGTSTSRSLGVVVTPLPQQPGPISGPVSPCVNSYVLYQTNGATDATSYTWQFPNGWNGGGNLDSSYVLVDTAVGNVVVTGVNICGSGPSRSFAVKTTPVDTPTVVVLASSLTICKGDLDTFSAITSNAGTSPSYQWRKNGIVVGTNSPNYSDITLNNGDTITVTLTSSLPCVNQPSVRSQGVVVRVNPIVVPGININSRSSITLCSGVSETFLTNDTGAGTSPMYQWYKNGSPIAGATTPAYTDAGLASKDTLMIVMTSSAPCAVPKSVNSNKVGVTVLPSVVPSISISANPAGPYPVLIPVTFTISAVGGGATPTYQWYKNGVKIPFATGTSYLASSYVNGDQYSVDMQSYDPCASPKTASSNVIDMVLNNTAVNGYNTISGEMSLYPNPSTGHLTLRVQWPQALVGKSLRLEVMNNLGQLVYQTSLNPERRDWTYDFDLKEPVANGNYMLRLSGSEFSGVLRFVVDR